MSEYQTKRHGATVSECRSAKLSDMIQECQKAIELVSECQISRTLEIIGCQNARFPAYQTDTVYSYQSARIPDCQKSRIPIYQSARLTQCHRASVHSRFIEEHYYPKYHYHYILALSIAYDYYYKKYLLQIFLLLSLA